MSDVMDRIEALRLEALSRVGQPLSEVNLIDLGG